MDVKKCMYRQDWNDKVRNCHKRKEMGCNGLDLKKSLVASRISEMVTGEFFRLKSELLSGIFSVGDKLDGLILLTTSTAAVTIIRTCNIDQ